LVLLGLILAMVVHTMGHTSVHLSLDNTDYGSSEPLKTHLVKDLRPRDNSTTLQKLHGLPIRTRITFPTPNRIFLICSCSNMRFDHGHISRVVFLR